MDELSTADVKNKIIDDLNKFCNKNKIKEGWGEEIKTFSKNLDEKLMSGSIKTSEFFCLLCRYAPSVYENVFSEDNTLKVVEYVRKDSKLNTFCQWLESYSSNASLFSKFCNKAKELTKYVKDNMKNVEAYKDPNRICIYLHLVIEENEHDTYMLKKGYVQYVKREKYEEYQRIISIAAAGNGAIDPENIWLDSNSSDQDFIDMLDRADDGILIEFIQLPSGTNLEVLVLKQLLVSTVEYATKNMKEFLI